MRAQATNELESLSDDIFGGDITGNSSQPAQGIDASVNSNRVGTEVEKYVAIYKRLIQQQLIINDSFKGRQCTILLKLTSTGAVRSATNPKGDSALCDATLRAIAKVPIFPLSPDPAVKAQLLELNLITQIE